MERDAEGLPLFTIAVLVREVPAELAALPPDARVHYSEARAGRRSEGITSAGDLAETLRERVARQAVGWFEIEEAAQLLEDAARGRARGWREKLAAAAQVGDLAMHEPGTLERITYGTQIGARPVRTFYDLAHVDDLNRWLSEHEPRLPYRFDGAATPKPVQRHYAQEEAILAKLGELGFMAKAVPAAPVGKRSQAKQAVREKLSYSTDVMNKAWQRLRADGRIKDA